MRLPHHREIESYTIHRRSAAGVPATSQPGRSRTTESRPGARSCELFAGNVPLSHATERSLQRRPENRTAWDASARAFVSRAAWWPPLSRRSVLELGRRDSRRESLLWRLGRTQRIRASRACSAPACSKNAASFRGAVQGREEMLEQLKAHDDIERSIVERQYRCVLDYLCVEPPLRASATACSLRPSRAPAPGRPRAPGPARDRSWERRRCPIRCDGQPHPSGTLPWLPVAVASERPRPRSRPDPSKVNNAANRELEIAVCEAVNADRHMTLLQSPPEVCPPEAARSLLAASITEGGSSLSGRGGMALSAGEH